MDVNESGSRKRHPKETANFFSKVTFFYNLGILWNTYKNGTFERNQLPEVIEKCKAQASGNKLEDYIQNDIKKNKKFSLLRILWKCYGFEYLILGLIQLIVRSIVIITIPTILSKVVLYFQPDQQELSKRDVIIFASSLILLNFVSITYLHNYLLILSELGIKVRTAFCSIIFRKCLKISSRVLSDIGTGKIVTLMTKDVTAIENFIFYANDMWVGVMQTVIVFYLIYSKMGISTLIGMGFFVAVIPGQILIGKITSKLRMKSSKKTDERLQITKETLTGIGVVKMNNWENIFKEKINAARKNEMQNILKIFLTKTSVLLIGTLTSKLAFYLLISSYIFLGNSISAELVYYVTTLFLRIRHALNVAIPIGVTITADLSASVKRIEHLMNSAEVTKKENIEKTKEPYVSLEDVTVQVNNKKILKNVNIKFDHGLIVITGPTGSGKTTLLKTILEECDIRKGKMLKKGKISYASQEPWIFPSTLKQNIIFKEDFDEERYKKVLDICALNFDFQHIPSGDNFKVGDNGTNLSKGQKARINLARAIYKKADIYLLDDSLSSVDTHVQKYVFQKSIKEFLASKICLFVTQNLQNVEGGDKIILIDRGRVLISQKLFDIPIHPGQVMNDENKFNKIIEINNDVEEKITEKSELLKKHMNKGGLYEEAKKSGKVDFKVYQKYGTYGGGLVIMLVICIFFIITQFSKSYTDKIISNWVDIVHQNATKHEIMHPKQSLKNIPFRMYTSFTLSTTILSVISIFLLFNFTRRASIKFHKYMINSILNASMQFFDKHLIGNILNRFSKDLNIVDEQISFTIHEILEVFFGLVGTISLMVSVNVIFLIPTVIIIWILYLIRKLYMPTGRNLQRLDVAARSPVIGYLNSSLEGLVTARAFHAEKILALEFDRHQDLYTSANYTSKCCQRSFGYYLDFFCTVFISVVIAVCIIFDKEISVGDVGLTITQAFMLTGVVQYGIRQWANIENKMTSVERILEYTDIDKEFADLNGVYSGWPKENTIEYKNVFFSYDENKNYVLKDINLTIDNREKIGIVGRTGSGKSSFLSLLFRLYPYEGTITLGGLDITNIPLNILRSKISIIAQDPVLFSGTIRSNLDPAKKHSDEELWTAIETLQIQKLIRNLDFEISESGSNFSAGQKQIICLVRCLLAKNKIIILDEATSDMDQESEKLIGKVLEKCFEDCTVVIVAHKLKTVMNCDRIVVMQEGEIVENGDIRELKRNKNSIFYGMLQKANLL